MHKLIVGLLVPFLVLMCGIARADVTFNVAGSFSNGGSLAGEFTVDDASNMVLGSVDLDYLPVGNVPIEFYNLFESIDGSTVTLQVTNGGAVTDFGLVMMFAGPLGTPTLGPITGGFVFGFQPGVLQVFPGTCAFAFACVAQNLVGTVTAVPEPTTLALLGLGLAGLAFARRKSH